MMTSHSLLGRHCQLSRMFDNFDIDVHGRLDTVRRQEIWTQVQNFQLSLLMASFKDLCLPNCPLVINFADKCQNITSSNISPIERPFSIVPQ